MAVWSSLAVKTIVKNFSAGRSLISSFKNAPKVRAVTYVPVRGSHDRTIVIRNSTFDALKFKDLFYFYLIIGALPLVSIILYCNIFIGPATLALIPEGYDPKPWEYHRHPISRFMAKYVTRSPQEAYERSVNAMFVRGEKIAIKNLEKKVKNLIKQRGDYQSWYFEKATVKHARKMHEFAEGTEKTSGRPTGWIF